MDKISITANRADKLLLKEYIKYLIKEVKNIEEVDGYINFLRKCEKSITEFMGVEDTLLVNSWTDAIQLSLLSLNVKKGDEVIIPATTYISVALAIWYTGAKVVPVDISEEDMLIDAGKLKRKITPKTKVIIMVHMFGHSCKIDEIVNIAKEYNIKIIDNACQAIGTKYKNKRVGSFGDIGTLSFSYAKTISSFSGNGGAVLLKNKNDKERIRENFLDIFKGRNGLFKLDRKFHNISFLDALTVYVKLKHFNEIEEKKILLRKIYEKELREVNEVTIFPDSDDSVTVRPCFFILAEKRDSLIKYLYRKGIVCESSYPPLVVFKKFGKFNYNEFNVAFKCWKMGLRLPLFSYMEPGEAVRVCKEIKNFYARKK